MEREMQAYFNHINLYLDRSRLGKDRISKRVKTCDLNIVYELIHYARTDNRVSFKKTEESVNRLNVREAFYIAGLLGDKQMYDKLCEHRNTRRLQRTTVIDEFRRGLLAKELNVYS
jgi:hypothetical protein